MSPKTIRVFEYERLRVGQVCQAVEGGEVTFGRGEFDALVRFGDASTDRVVDVGHRWLCFRNHVGYVQVGRVGIEVLPKADRHQPGDRLPWRDALLDMLAVVHGLRRLHATDAHLAVRPASLFETYLDHFLGLMESLLRQGLARGYRKVRENCAAFRGRLLVEEDIRRNLTQAQRVFVERQVYDHDILVNRTLKAALTVLDRTALSGPVRSRLMRVRGTFPEMVSPTVDLDALDRIVLGRSTERYGDALGMARLILGRRAPTLQVGGEPVLALLFDMSVLWERYVASLLRRAAPSGLRVRVQDSRRFWEPANSPVRTVRPDILVVDGVTGDARLVLDTKWKVPKNGRPSDDDLRQMFVYNELYGCRESLLVYPETGLSTPSRGTFTRGGHACGTHFVSLFADGKYSRAVARHEAARVFAAARSSATEYQPRVF